MSRSFWCFVFAAEPVRLGLELAAICLYCVATIQEHHGRDETSYGHFIALFLPVLSSFAQATSPGGIVYGPKAAFKISAPSDWVLDNSAGVEQGLPCVLYPKDSSWQDAKTIITPKIAGRD